MSSSYLHLEQVSWCKFEVTVDCSKDIKVATNPANTGEIPPVIVTAINLKTIINQKQNTNEIASASVICCHKAKVPHILTYFGGNISDDIQYRRFTCTSLSHYVLHMLYHLIGTCSFIFHLSLCITCKPASN